MVSDHQIAKLQEAPIDRYICKFDMVVMSSYDHIKPLRPPVTTHDQPPLVMTTALWSVTIGRDHTVNSGPQLVATTAVVVATTG